MNLFITLSLKIIKIVYVKFVSLILDNFWLLLVHIHYKEFRVSCRQFPVHNGDAYEADFSLQEECFIWRKQLHRNTLGTSKAAECHEQVSIFQLSLIVPELRSKSDPPHGGSEAVQACHECVVIQVAKIIQLSFSLRPNKNMLKKMVLTQYQKWYITCGVHLFDFTSLQCESLSMTRILLIHVFIKARVQMFENTYRHLK